MQSDKLKELLEFQIKRNLNGVAKVTFFILDDLIANGYIIPEDKYKYYRKLILDKSGESTREIKSQLDNLDIKFKE